MIFMLDVHGAPGCDGRRGVPVLPAGLALALDLGVIDRLLPEVKTLIGCEQEPDWHPEGDVWTHTLMVVDKARALNGDLDRPQLITVMLGAVFTTSASRRPRRSSTGRFDRLGTRRPASSRRGACSIA